MLRFFEYQHCFTDYRNYLSILHFQICRESGLSIMRILVYLSFYQVSLHCYWKWEFSSNIETYFQFGYLYRWSYKAIISLFEGYRMVVCINSYRSIIAVSAIWRIISEHLYRHHHRNLENSLFMNVKWQYIYHHR